MIFIKKNKTPTLLKKYQADPNSKFESMDGKDKNRLREILSEEQNGLCAYCMQRIRPDSSSVKIEHIKPQSRFPEDDLNYNNMVAVCTGGQGYPRKNQTCDTRKGDLELKILSPVQSNVERYIIYNKSGWIAASGDLTSREQELVNSDLENVLNLNCRKLIRNRKSVLDGYIQAVAGEFKGKKVPRHYWEKEEEDYRAGARASDPYKGIILNYFNKKLKSI